MSVTGERRRKGAMHDLVITGGRVIDPETQFDAVCNVGIDGDEITLLSAAPVDGVSVIDAAGSVVAPGFIDLHSHGQDIGELRLQALDGVTTALELEAGAGPVNLAYRRSQSEGRPINFGFSASWAAVRQHVMDGSPFDAMNVDKIGERFNDPGWLSVGTAKDADTIVGMLRAELEAGALGIGILLGYSPKSSPDEFVEIAKLAAEAGAPTFTHARPLVEQDPRVAVDGAWEIYHAAAMTGAHMHFCHINSTSNRYLDRAFGVVAKAQLEGSTVTAEAYPYGAGWSFIGGDYYQPSRLHVLGFEVTDLIYARTGEAIQTVDELVALRAADPGAPVYAKFYDEESNQYRLARNMALPGACIASDAIPFTSIDRAPFDQRDWPIPPHVRAHPRNAGTYSRTLRIGVRETGMIPLPEALAKCSLYPARILEGVAPAMKRKGRLQVGCDADIVVFDPQLVSDTATLKRPLATSIGFRHVLVGGQSIVRDSEIVLDALPGRAIRGEPT